MQRVRWFLGDVAAVAVFALIGRLAHERGLDLAGFAETAWPFMVALLAGWTFVVARGGSGTGLAESLLLWAATLVFGMWIRSRAGGGVEPSFVAVAGTFLAVTMLGGRFVASRLRRRTAS